MRCLPILLLLLATLPLKAETPPACAAGHEGTTACFGEKLCECRWEPGGSLTGRPAGHRWDCGVMRPRCGVVPAGPPSMPLPAMPGGGWINRPGGPMTKPAPQGG